MSASSRTLAAAGGLFLLIAASGSPGDPGQAASGQTTAPVASVPRLVATVPRSEPGPLETRRIQGHLLNVERALRGRAAGELSARQRERRNAALDWLREYRERGTFPHNHTKELEESSSGAELSFAANTALGVVSGYVAWTFLRSRSDESETSRSGADAFGAMRMQRPRLLPPAAAWVGGGVGLQVRLIH